MTNADFDRVKLAVRERLGCAVPDEAEDGFELVLDGQQAVSVGFDAETGQLTIRASLSMPADALSAAARRHLLARNLPTPGMAGSMVRTSPAGSRLELVNILPVAAMAPADIAGMAINQAAEAVRLAEWLARN